MLMFVVCLKVRGWPFLFFHVCLKRLASSFRIMWEIRGSVIYVCLPPKSVHAASTHFFRVCVVNIRKCTSYLLLLLRQGLALELGQEQGQVPGPEQQHIA